MSSVHCILSIAIVSIQFMGLCSLRRSLDGVRPSRVRWSQSRMRGDRSKKRRLYGGWGNRGVLGEVIPPLCGASGSHSPTSPMPSPNLLYLFELKTSKFNPSFISILKVFWSSYKILHTSYIILRTSYIILRSSYITLWSSYIIPFEFLLVGKPLSFWELRHIVVEGNRLK